MVEYRPYCLLKITIDNAGISTMKNPEIEMLNWLQLSYLHATIHCSELDLKWRKFVQVTISNEEVLKKIFKSSAIRIIK